MLVLVLGITTGILAARMLLPEGRGALAAIILWPHIIVGLGILGLNESLIYRLGNKDVDRGKAIASALMAAFLLSVLMVIIGWVLRNVRSGSRSPEATSYSSSSCRSSAAY